MRTRRNSLRSVPALLALPALALGASLSGTVRDLAGVPVAGATVTMGSTTVVTGSDGTWSAGASAGAGLRSARPVAVSPRLRLENGHLRVSFSGIDIAGRSSGSRQILSNSGVPTARTAEGPDTLRVYWKGKRLAVLPASRDSSGIVVTLDTAWSDDAGLPWNARVSYGSLRDARDGHTYRTVRLGGRTWMAENLAWKADSSLTVPGDDGSRYGRLYPWTRALSAPDSCAASLCPDVSRSRGACPVSWHVPDTAEINALRSAFDPTGLRDALRMRSSLGWTAGEGVVPGLDSLGLRALPAGLRTTGGVIMTGISALWWSSTQSATGAAPALVIDGDLPDSYPDPTSKPFALSVRCVQDETPASVSGSWTAAGVLGETLDRTYTLSLEGDRFLLRDSLGALYDGTVAERQGPRWRLAPVSGRLASRNPDGWIRLDTAGQDLFLNVISRHLTGQGNAGFPAGTWSCASFAGGAGTLTMGPDSAWTLQQTGKSSSGKWWNGTYPDAASLLGSGIEAPFASWLGGRPYLSVLSDPHLLEGDASHLWLDLIGDGALLRLRRTP